LLDWFWIIFDARLTLPAVTSESVNRHTNVVLRTIRGSSHSG
jgi:hypothetical protein